MTGGKTSGTTLSTETEEDRRRKQMQALWDAEDTRMRALRLECIDFIKSLREAGVYKYKGHSPSGDMDIEIASRVQTFEVPNPAHFQHEPVNELDNDDDIELPAKDMPVVRGRDGLTAEEQADLYGNVIDAVPRDGEE